MSFQDSALCQMLLQITGGQGQYGRVMGYVEPLNEEEAAGQTVIFENRIVGNAIPPNFIPACEKGFREACNSGHLTGHPVEVYSNGRTMPNPCLVPSCFASLCNVATQQPDCSMLPLHPVTQQPVE